MAMVDPNPVKKPLPEPPLLRGLTFVAWLGAFVLLGFVALRFAHVDNSPLVATSQSLTLYLLLPAWFALGFAIGARKRALIVITGVLSVTHLVWLYPEVHASGRIDIAALTAPRLRVFSANIRAQNARITELADEIRTSRPDVVLLQEYDTENRIGIQASGVLVEFPYQVEFRQNSVFGALLASKVPFIESSLVEVSERGMPRAVLDTPIGPVEIVCVHTSRPVTAAEHRGWVRQQQVLAHLVRDRRQPVVLAGDFNATTQNGPFRDILDAGVADAHQALGEGLSNSWPKIGWLPPLIRIDHVLTTQELVPLRLQNGEGAGSDHLPVIADIALVGAR